MKLDSKSMLSSFTICFLHSLLCTGLIPTQWTQAAFLTNWKQVEKGTSATSHSRVLLEEKTVPLLTSEEIPCAYKTRRFNTTHKSPPFVPFLGKIKPVHTLPAYFFKIHFNFILLHAVSFLQVSPPKSCMHSPPPIHITCPPHLILDKGESLMRINSYSQCNFSIKYVTH